MTARASRITAPVALTGLAALVALTALAVACGNGAANAPREPAPVPEAVSSSSMHAVPSADPSAPPRDAGPPGP